MRARLALSISGEMYEHREVLLRNKPAHMLSASPKGTVPVLILENGKIIDESFDIMLWALGQNDPQNWLAHSFDSMAFLIDTITGNFKHHLDRYKYASRYTEGAGRESVDLSHREKASALLAGLEDRLAQTKNLMGQTLSLADMAIFPFIRQFSNVEKTWWDTLVFPYLHAWLERHINSELFLGIMEKRKPWQP